MLLKVYIPTYKRLKEFDRQFTSIASQISELSSILSQKIALEVLENPSEETEAKASLFRSKLRDLNLDPNNFSFLCNEKNIGGDKNICQCFSHSYNSDSRAEFSWVLGDDDFILPGTIKVVLEFLIRHGDKISLVLIRDSSYEVHSDLLGKLFDCYKTFARLCLKLQPHLLIGHTLISANIFRSTCFDEQEADYVNNVFNKRVGLVANFAHMRGLVKGLLSRQLADMSDSGVCILNFPVLDTNKRSSPSESAMEVERQMPFIYYFYFTWLLLECGELPINYKFKQNNMSWYNKLTGR